MASQAQILANQKNATHSTGPRTDEGKQRASQNSFKHGLTSNVVVLPTEDMAVYQEFCANMLTTFEPVGAMEQQLAQTAIDAQWRLNRIAALETNLLALAQYEPAPDHIAAVENPQTRAALLQAHGLVKYDRQLRNLHLQEQRLHRIIRRAHEDLVAHQTAREANESEASEENGFDFDPLKFHLHYVSKTPESTAPTPADPTSETQVRASAA